MPNLCHYQDCDRSMLYPAQSESPEQILNRSEDEEELATFLKKHGHKTLNQGHPRNRLY